MSRARARGRAPARRRSIIGATASRNWRRCARRRDVKSRSCPGDRRADPRLDAASTLRGDAVDRVWRYFDEGGLDNLAACLALSRFRARRRGGRRRRPRRSAPSAASRPPVSRPRRTRRRAAHRLLSLDLSRRRHRADRGAGPGAPRAGASRSTSVFVTSLKDERRSSRCALSSARRPDVIAQHDRLLRSPRRRRDGARRARRAGPAGRAGGRRPDAWRSFAARPVAGRSGHACRPARDRRAHPDPRDLVQGGEPARRARPSSPRAHQPLADRVAYVARSRSPLGHLRRTAPSRQAPRLRAVGLSRPAAAAPAMRSGSTRRRARSPSRETLRAAGYDVACDLDAPSLIAALTARSARGDADARRIRRRALFDSAGLQAHRSSPRGASPPTILTLIDGAFRFRFVRLGKLVVACSPTAADARRARAITTIPSCRRATPTSRSISGCARTRSRRDHPSRHARHARMAAGQGGRALARTARPKSCSARLPVIYPFIVNNPGEAAQAKRRIAAVDDRPSDAAADRRRVARRGRRARRAVRRIRRGARARSAAARAPSPRLDPGARGETGLARECGRRRPSRPRRRCRRSTPGSATSRRCASATACTCSAARPRARTAAAALDPTPAREAESACRACGAAESLGLVARPRRPLRRAGPGRRAVARPARRAADRAQSLLHRSARRPDPHRLGDRQRAGRRDSARATLQDHGDWPRAWSSTSGAAATMRTGGDDLAQAFALIGAGRPGTRPRTASPASRSCRSPMLGRPRVDVTLRISGLFRDVFPSQIALFDAAVRAVAALDDERRRQSARRGRGWTRDARVRRGAGRLRRRARPRIALDGDWAHARGSGRGLSRRDQPRL